MRWLIPLGSAVCLLVAGASCSLRPLSQQLDAAVFEVGSAIDQTKSDGAGAAERRPTETGGEQRGGDGNPPSACPSPPFSETADSTYGSGWYSSIAIDRATGELHIVHQQGTTQNARHTFGRTGHWQSEALSSDGSSGQNSAVALDGSGRLHLVYFDSKVFVQTYRMRDSAGSWGAAQPFSGTAGGGNDLVVDAKGDLHWVTYSKFATEVIYRRTNQGSWAAPIPIESAAASAGPKPGIGLSPDGTKVWVSLINQKGELKLCSIAGGTLQSCPVVDTGLGSYGTSDLAVDGGGDVHIVYYDSNNHEQRFVGQKGGSLTVKQTLAFVGGTVAMENAIAATSSGDLWIAYFNASKSASLELVRRKQGVFGKPETVEPAAGRYLSLALGPGGELHISHLAPTTQQLHHSRVCP